MSYDYAVITGFLGKSVDRFKEYQQERSLEEKLKLAAELEDVAGVELVYPSDFEDPGKTQDLIEDLDLGVSALNVNIKSEPKWNRGALTARSGETREEAVRYLKDGLDLARQLEAPRVTCCPLHDGHDYPFQIHYGEAWNRAVDCIKRAADYGEEIDLCLEYKMKEPMNRQTLGTVGKTLQMATETERENVGVTVDVGHALLAGENPAESFALVCETGKPVYLHINDNLRDWDWDMIAGTANVWDYLELILYLKEYGYEGWVGIDVTPKYFELREVYETTVHVMRRLEEIAAGLGSEALAKGEREQFPRHFRRIFDQLFGP